MKTLVRLLTAVLPIILLSSEPALAGAPPIQWQNTFGGSEPDYGYSVQQTIDGGYVITGWTKSYGAGYEDVYLIKTDPNGNKKWQKTFGGSYSNYGWSVQQTSDGGYIIVGRTLPFGPGVYLVKTDPNGNTQWQNTFGGNGGDYGHSVQQTADSGYIIAGSTTSYGAGSYDVYLIKTDPNGNSQWQKTFGGTSHDEGYSVQQTSDGGYIIAGETWSFGAGGWDVYLIKTYPNGNMQWQKTFGGKYHEFGWSVRQTSDGGYIVVGETYSYGAGSWDVYFIKTDPNGNSQWEKTFGGKYEESGYAVQKTSDGGFIITGSTYSYSTVNNVYLIKTDSAGNMQWEKTFGGANDDFGQSVQQTSDGGYIIAGSTESYGAGWADVYLIKLCSDGTLSADLNCNGTVNFEDFAVLADQWLQPPGILSADMAPEPGDGTVNFLDFAVFAENWLETTVP
jgi:hypothetical protein